MKRKPWPIVVLASLHWISPLGNILANSYQTNSNLIRYIEALFFPTNLFHFLVIVVLPILAGTCIYMCRKWSYALYIALMTIPFFYSFYNTHGNFYFGNVLFILMLYFINVLIVGYFLNPNVRKIYFNPRLRWWQSHPRFESNFSAIVTQGTATEIAGQIKNISMGGFFIELESPIELEKDVLVRFTHQEKEVSVTARPVFHRLSPPAGYGFKIERRDSKKSGLRKIVLFLKSQGALLKSRAPGPEDSFRMWLKTAWKSRTSWILESRSQ